MSSTSFPDEEAVAAAYQAVGALIYHFGLQENADCIRLQDVLAYGKTEDGIELLPWPRDTLPSEHEAIRADRNVAVAEAAKLRARVMELEGPEEVAGSAEDEQRGKEAADKAVMSLEAMAFNWIATTDIHKAIAAASEIAGPHADKLGSCIHGLVSQAWIEGAGTGFDARRKLTVAAREQIAEFELMFDMTREADRRGVDMWREANPGNEMVMPDRGDLVAWLVEQLAEMRGAPAKGRTR